jgi:hypothetical protein
VHRQTAFHGSSFAVVAAVAHPGNAQITSPWLAMSQIDPFGSGHSFGQRGVDGLPLSPGGLSAESLYDTIGLH